MYMAELQKKYESDPVLSKSIELSESDVLRVLNGAYLAERFFGKSRSWFCQKLNHSIVNGKPSDFTKEERVTLANALTTIGLELMELSDEIKDGMEVEG